MHRLESPDDFVFTRRDFLKRTGMGMGGLGLAAMLPSMSATAAPDPFAPKQPHFAGKAKRVIHIFLNGGLSQVDSFDPKPMLTKFDGSKIPIENSLTERRTGGAMASAFKFKKYGESGIEVSELFEKTAQSIDDVCVIRSMYTDVPNHSPSTLMMTCGDGILSRPSMGAWVTYGLGTENQNLPGFIAMCPGGYPNEQSRNWQSSFLPGVFQGNYIDSQHTSVEKLIENIRNYYSSAEGQRKQLDLLNELNAIHQQERERDALIEARIQSYEVAYRMQMEASDAFDIDQEPQHIRDMYGSSAQSRQLLIARRLLERGVRFLQVWHGPGQPWDSHDEIVYQHKRLASQIDQGIGALLVDLKQRGMLEDTLVLCVGEFGRTPTVELAKPGINEDKARGRDHNHYGFSAFLAGGGVKGGHVHGATDDFGFKAVEDPVHVHDLHATMLHLLGFNHEKLTFRHAGRDFRLTDVHGRVIHDIIA